MLPTRTLCQEANIEGRTYCRPKQAVILAGGRGTRLRPITNSRPKPMVSILGRPFLEYQVEQLREQGFERVLLLLGYLPHVVSQYFGDGGRWGVKIEYSVTGADDLTSSRVENARHLIDPCFLLLYCDNYWPMQMDRMWQRFQAAAKPAMITVYSNKDHYSRGSVILDVEGHVQVYDRLRTTSGLEGVEISYAILTDLALELLPQQDTRLRRQSTRRWQGRDVCGLCQRPSLLRCWFAQPSAENGGVSAPEPAIILDRDGVLNRKPAARPACKNRSGWRWLPGALEALRLLRQARYRVIVASNQAGINRGAMTLSDLNSIHALMRAEAEAAGGGIDTVFFCPHDWNEGCACRKPKPGLLLPGPKAVRFGFDPRSVRRGR